MSYKEFIELIAENGIAPQNEDAAVNGATQACYPMLVPIVAWSSIPGHIVVWQVVRRGDASPAPISVRFRPKATAMPKAWRN
ncbi:MAG TPA: hypothetical protein VGK19_05310 [Capsulimonadaceae bacterium]|jgi:hypothetical protein